MLPIHLENSSFEEFVSYIEKEAGLTIYFRKEQTAGISVTISSEAISVQEALEAALRGTGLIVSPWNNSYVILLNDQLPEELPVFRVEQQQADTREAEQVTTSEERYLQGRKSDVTETIVIGDKNIQSNGKIRVAGKITDLDTGEPIIGATVYIEETKTGAATDLHGFFIIILPRGKYNARFASMGYETGKYLLDVYSNGRIQISLQNAPLSIQEAVIMGDRQMDIRRKDPGLEKISV
ncbi:MAG: carboxypeptidase-like regulatory domain-containing protein, partial [Bacteroidales bacterium]|nr:carboxypeptidase-like regulatory domain-containing protein [Bacteroidales bacterium]